MFTTHFLNPFTFWPDLSVIQKLFSLILAAVAAVILYRLGRILVCLVGIGKNAVTPEAQKQLRDCESQLGGVRQLQFFISYLFGFYLFMQMPDAFHTLTLSHSSMSAQILQNLGVQFAYATDACSVLLTLHTVQWVISARAAAFAVCLEKGERLARRQSFHL